LKTVRQLLAGESIEAFNEDTTDTYQASKKVSSLACKELIVAVNCHHASNDIKYKILARHYAGDADSEVTLKAEATRAHGATIDTLKVESGYPIVWVEVKNDSDPLDSSAKVWMNVKGA